ncbi:hypothetical protein CCZ01_02220 [Helicobacter monodelphidis]|uniref:helix-turn-helix transcriptional regulator n=1 Tax=Helicobacter sp. 15-1451 TaxID=2004995 RepID=UPI000DCC9638|nr:transcriptional regulator [Helicobacter sp. 15-1451]RAX58623.1 hypothetical protein CCZ01_02220 [Helicobacter sp. 15-1451]
MQQNYEKLSIRLGKILELLYEGKEFSLKELSEKFGVSERTLQRDLYERLGDKITKQNGVFKLLNHTQIQHQNRYDRTISILKEVSKGIGEDFSKTADEIFDLFKIAQRDSYATKLFLDDISAKSALIHKIENAITQNFILKIRYKFHDMPIECVVTPIQIVCLNGIWYLIAANQDGICKININSIVKLKSKKDKKGQNIPQQKNIQDIVGESFCIKESRINVKLQINSEIADYFKNKKFTNLQTIIEQDNKNLVVEFAVSSLEEIKGEILRWLPYVIVLEPKLLRDDIQKTILDYQKLLNNQESLA